MKTTILTAALIGAILLPLAAFAAPKIVDGCEIVPVAGTNYFNKADPNCVWLSDITEDTTDDELDGLPPTPGN